MTPRLLRKSSPTIPDQGEENDIIMLSLVGRNGLNGSHQADLHISGSLSTYITTFFQTTRARRDQQSAINNEYSRSGRDRSLSIRETGTVYFTPFKLLNDSIKYVHINVTYILTTSPPYAGGIIRIPMMPTPEAPTSIMSHEQEERHHWSSYRAKLGDPVSI